VRVPIRFSASQAARAALTNFVFASAVGFGIRLEINNFCGPFDTIGCKLERDHATSDINPVARRSVTRTNLERRARSCAAARRYITAEPVMDGAYIPEASDGPGLRCGFTLSIDRHKDSVGGVSLMAVG